MLSAAETFRTDEGNFRLNHIQTQWLEEHHRKIDLLARTLKGIGSRLQDLGSEIEDRIQRMNTFPSSGKRFASGMNRIRKRSESF